MKIEFDTKYQATFAPGIYACTVTKVEDKINSNQKPYTQIDLEVTGSEGSRTISYFMYHNFAYGVQNTFRSFGFDLTGKTEIDTRLLCNKSAYCEVSRGEERVHPASGIKYRPHDIERFIHPDKVELARQELNATKRHLSKDEAPVAIDSSDADVSDNLEYDDIPF